MKIRYLHLTLLALLLFACKEKVEPGTSAVSRPTVTGVRLTAARVVSRPLAYEAVGTVAAGITSDLAAKVMGTVERIAVREGDRVKKGDLLLSLDDREAKARLAEAEHAFAAARSAQDGARAGADLAAATLTRYEALKREESVSAQEFDEVAARNRQAQAARDQADAMAVTAASRVDQARVALDDTRIVAPHAGVITGKLVDVGDLGTPGRPLLVLETAKGYRLDVPLPEEYVNRVRLRQRVEVTIPALNLAVLQGTVTTIVPAADPRTRSFLIKVSLPPEAGVKSGMYARAAVPLGESNQVLIPQTAVLRRGQLTGLYVVDGEGTAHFRLIRLGRSFQDQVEVLSGISDGERYVVEPVPTLVDGARVEAAP
jgi:RND family efflux transporter MFP subunit